MLKPIIISAPFGNYFSYPGATSPTMRMLTLERKPYVVPPTAGATPYRAGETLEWTLVGD